MLEPCDFEFEDSCPPPLSFLVCFVFWHDTLVYERLRVQKNKLGMVVHHHVQECHIGGHTAFQKFVSADAKHNIFCIGGMKNLYMKLTIYKVCRRK